MRRPTTAILVLAIAALTSSAEEMGSFYGCTPETRELLEKMAAGIGGVAELSEIRVLRSFATIEQVRREAEDPLAIELLSSFPNRHRARVLTDEGSLTITINHDDAYILPAKAVIEGAAIRLSSDEKMDLLHYFNTDPLFIAHNIRRREYRFAAGRREQIGDRECQELKVEVNGVSSSWWIDLETGYVLRSDFQSRRLDFSDFRKVGALTVPFQVTTRLDGEVISTASFTRYEINPEINIEAIFRKPSLWIARFSIPDRRTQYGGYSSYGYSSYSGYSSSYSNYSGYTYRPPQVTTRDPGVVIWDSRSSLIH